MASLAATNWPKPLVLVPCLSWSTASAVFTEGVMSDSIDWELLQEQYLSNSLFYDRLANLVTIIDTSFINKTCKMKTCSESFDIETSKSNVALKMLEQLSIDDNAIKNLNNIKQSGLYAPNISNGLRLSAFMYRTMDVNSKKSNIKKPRDAVQFMRGIMDECTHLKNFSVPFDTSLIIAVCAQSDGYVPREGCSSLEEIWPGATVKYLDGGHVSAYILYRKFFRNCIIEAFEKAKTKCL